MLDLAKEFGFDNQLLKALVTLVVGLLIVVAGYCWKSPSRSWKIVAVVLLIVPPAAFLLQGLDASDSSRISDAMRAIPLADWARLGGFMAIGVLIAILHRVFQQRPSDTAYG